MSTAPLRLVAAQPDWREALQTAIRPEFRLASYEPAADDPRLYGPHCAAAGCELPIHRPVNGPGGVYVCNAHAHNYHDHGPRDVQLWLAGAGPLRTQRRRRPSYRLEIGGALLLRYGLECWHDGQPFIRRVVDRFRRAALGIDDCRAASGSARSTSTSAPRTARFLCGAVARSGA